MRILTHKDGAFLTTGFAKVADLKEIVIDILEHYKMYWKGTNWDYLITEYDNGTDPDLTYGIRIECGIDKSTVIKVTRICPTTNFADHSRNKMYAWREIIRNIGCAGIATIYQETTMRNREEASVSSETLNRLYPLTPNDCIK